MLISELIKARYGHVSMNGARVSIDPSRVPTLHPSNIGPGAAEAIARFAGVVYGECTVKFSGTAFRGPVYSHGQATIRIVDGWRIVTQDETWRRYGPGLASTIFGTGTTLTRFFVDDVDAEQSITELIQRAFAQDDAERAERVVWRARHDSVVVKAIFAGDWNGGDVLLPDGSVRELSCSDAVHALLREELGASGHDLVSALRDDGVPGRSSVGDGVCQRVIMRALPVDKLERLRELEIQSRASWKNDMRSWRAQSSAACAARRGKDLLGWKRADFVAHSTLDEYGLRDL